MDGNKTDAKRQKIVSSHAVKLSITARSDVCQNTQVNDPCWIDRLASDADGQFSWAGFCSNSEIERIPGADYGAVGLVCGMKLCIE